MLYCSWDMVLDACNYFSFWTIFDPFTLLIAPRNQNLKKWKKHLEISSSYTYVPKIMIIWYTVSEIWCMTDVIVIFHLWLFLYHFTPVKAQKNKLLKKWKKMPVDIIILHMCTKNYHQMMYGSWDVRCDRWTAGQTDGRMEKVTFSKFEKGFESNYYSFKFQNSCRKTLTSSKIIMIWSQ